jgi:hypothetical protein
MLAGKLHGDATECPLNGGAVRAGGWVVSDQDSREHRFSSAGDNQLLDGNFDFGPEPG